MKSIDEYVKRISEKEIPCEYGRSKKVYLFEDVALVKCSQEEYNSIMSTKKSIDDMINERTSNS